MTIKGTSPKTVIVDEIATPEDSDIWGDRFIVRETEGHKAPFIPLGDSLMQCPQCGMIGRGDDFMYVKCRWLEERE